MTTESSKEILTGRQDAIVNEVRGVVGQASELLHEAGLAVSAELAGTRQAVASRAHCVAEATQQYAHRNPWTIVGLAALAGLVVGAVVSRR